MGDSRRSSHGTVAIAVLTGAALLLSGCAYAYDAGPRPSPSATRETLGSAAFGPLLDRPAAENWAAAVFARARGLDPGEGAHHGVGTLRDLPGEETLNDEFSVPPGDYALSVACRVAATIVVRVAVDRRPWFAEAVECGQPVRIPFTVEAGQGVYLRFDMTSGVPSNVAYRVDPE
ncbi:hypothetical protein [Sinomonas sp. ASV322]|uniref:hypothetical protein n=1 Tax=Sinomonas sp. ASV322 TaxID=3041920 RepID=UPI0027DC8CEA|nr:hypothetical protein [Sinomonas sp. ASV322]MDQ4503783.1 hypothetical protein [Sinomonas sp. ASV322]